MYRAVQRDQKRVSGPWNWNYCLVWPSLEYWESSSGPLEEQQVLWATELSSQAHPQNFLIHAIQYLFLFLFPEPFSVSINNKKQAYFNTLTCFLCAFFWQFQILHKSIVFRLVTRTGEKRDLFSFFMWLFSCLSTVDWKDCPFFQLYFWHVCQKPIGCRFMNSFHSSPHEQIPWV